MKLRQSTGILLLSCLLLWFFSNPVALAQDSINPYYSNTGLSPSPCKVTLDGQPADYISLYINQNGQNMVCLRDVVLLFSCWLEYQNDGMLLLHHLGKVQTYSPKQYLCNGLIYEYTPLQRLDAVFLPLPSVAAGFDYQLAYKSQGPAIHLSSPAFQIVHPDLDIIPEDPDPALLPPEDLPKWGLLNSDLAARWPGVRIVGAYYTKLVDSPEGRTTNIILSCSRLNGTVLQDGEVLSFNRTVGERTVQAGYRVAKIFVGKTVQSGLGGGICQTATTLYNAGLETGMEIVERYPHTLPVNYCSPGRDATVSWGGADLKIKNSLGRPVQLLCCVYGNYVLAAFVEAGDNKED